MTINKWSSVPADGKEYLKELAQKQRPELSNTSFEIIPNIIQKNSEIVQSLLYTEANEVWNHDLFNKEGRVPVNVLETTDLLGVPVNAYANEMLVKLPGSNTLTLPDNFKPLAPLIQATVDIDASHFERFENDYVYLTFQEDMMQTDGFQRFHWCHVDGFQSHRVDPKLPIDRSYLAVDSDPTIFYPHAFDMSEYDTQKHDFFAVFNELAQEDKAVPVTSNGLYLFNAVSVHRASPTVTPGLRRFFRITCSKRVNDRAGCSKNPHIDYNWDFRLQQTRAKVKWII